MTHEFYEMLEMIRDGQIPIIRPTPQKQKMKNQYNNKTESVNGRLMQFFGVWKVQSGYGTFPLDGPLQTKPDTSSNGAWVEAKVNRGVVTDYHFAEEKI